MDRERVRALFEDVRAGVLTPQAASERLALLPFVDVEGARVDTHRALRQGLPEVVYGPGQTPQQICEIAGVLLRAGQSVLVTRVDAELARAVSARCERPPDYDAVARLLWFGPAEVEIRGRGTIAVVSAGTADLPVAAEAAAVARRFG